jgi:hypothetical protein
MTTSWLQTVAEKTGLTPGETELRLRRRGVSPDRALRPARRLVVTRIAFSGQKKGEGSGKIDFNWTPIRPGVWALASYKNLVGKSTVLEVLLWCLRGSPKTLQDDVRSWLDQVLVEITIDDQRYCIAFSLPDGVPSGTLSRLRPDGPSDVMDRFASDEVFAAVMSRFMMESLDLDPVPYRQGVDDEKQTVEHGWLALSGALYFGGDHKVLLGDAMFGGMPARMLQMYVGLPWALTVMQAGTAQKELEQEASRANKAAQTAQAAAANARVRIDRDLETARQKLKAATTERVAIEDLESKVKEVTRLTGLIVALEGRLAALKAHGQAIRQTADEDIRAVRDIRENQLATTFFNGLQPSCCPRCEGKVTKDRIAKEASSFHCSLCAEQISEEQLEDTNERIAEAEARTSASRAAVARYEADLKPAVANLQTANDDLKAAQAALAMAATGDIFRARREAELKIARLEGALAERTAAPKVETRSPDADLIDAAATAAKTAFETEHGDLVGRLNEEILRLGKAFGIVGLEEMNLNHNAQMRLKKGGQQTSFSKLTPGERLRLRIATAIALIRVGRERGVGRHPGLLIIDSPGAEETNESNLETLLQELNAVAGETDGLQILIASANALAVTQALGSGQCRIAKEDQYLW